MNDRNVVLSVKDLSVKFRVRGRELTAIRGISLDFYENESVAIVGESGSGKSVLTKAFAGMLEANGLIAGGSIRFEGQDLTKIRRARDCLRGAYPGNTPAPEYRRREAPDTGCSRCRI